jgi:hypothetical protein
MITMRHNFYTRFMLSFVILCSNISQIMVLNLTKQQLKYPSSSGFFLKCIVLKSRNCCTKGCDVTSVAFHKQCKL